MAARRARQSRSSAGADGQVRIIGGDWRGRRLSFPASPGLRPSGDRLRETLFNWLQGWVGGSRCLDLFAGSGALGLEAASRGAARVVLVERAGPVAGALRQNLDRLDCADRVRLEQADALDYLRDCRERFDLVFLDPPFAGDLWQAALAALDDAAVLLPTARVYLEAPAGATEPTLRSHWRLLRQVRQGEVVGRLYAVESPENCSGPDDQALSPLPLP